MSRLMEQKRAAHALGWARERVAEADIDNSKLKARVRSLPAMVRMNGFGQAIAFYTAKSGGDDGKAFKAVLDLLSDWLRNQNGANNPHAVYGGVMGTALIDVLVSQNQQRYRQAEAEAMALLLWARKFVEALTIADAETAGS